jgi:hypothetical protein
MIIPLSGQMKMLNPKFSAATRPVFIALLSTLLFIACDRSKEPAPQSESVSVPTESEVAKAALAEAAVTEASGATDNELLSVLSEEIWQDNLESQVYTRLRNGLALTSVPQGSFEEAAAQAVTAGQWLQRLLQRRHLIA